MAPGLPGPASGMGAAVALVGAGLPSELLGLNHLQEWEGHGDTDDGSQGIQARVTDGLEPLLTSRTMTLSTAAGADDGPGGGWPIGTV